MSLKTVASLLEDGKLVDALSVLDECMFEDPDDPKAMFLFGHIMMRSDKPALAKLAFEYVTQAEPDRHQGWNNLGKALDDLLRYEDAEECFRRAHDIEQNITVMENLSTNAVHRCEPYQAIKWAKKVIKKDPESIGAHLNLGFSYLSEFNFKEGWPEYDWGMGNTKWRDIRNYTGEPVWNGEKGKSVVVYGEQGLGDQIAFAGALQDMRKDCKNVILDVNPKLRNLFARSFLLETHGTMFNTDINWPYDRSNKIDASVSLSQIQKYYRNDRHQFPKGRYLTADPARRIQWRALLDSLPNKLKIGIAWTGGLKETQKTSRSTALETFRPLLEMDADFISLEYKDRSEEIRQFTEKTGIAIHDFPWGTQTKDYDDTAALVAELDLIISVPTSVVHLAGALNKPCFCIVHPKPHFMFGLKGNKMPYYDSVELFRREDSFEKPINQIIERINDWRK